MLRAPISCAILLALSSLTLAAPVVTWADDAPSAATADTLTVADVTGTSATVRATVNPHGLATIAHFDYGTTEDVPVGTTEVEVGAGTTDVPFERTITSLSPGTHYYVAVHAVNAAGGEYGDVLEFDTPPLPEIVAAATTDVTPTAATLHVGVVTHGLPVTVVAAVRGIGSRSASAPVAVTADGDVAVPLTGLKPDTGYSWGATATSAAGASSVRAAPSFKTLPLTAMPPPTLSASRAAYGSWVTVSGTLAGAPALPVALQQQPFPFSSRFPFVAVPGAAGATDADGSYRFTVQARATTRYGLLASGYDGPTPTNTARLTIVPAVTVRVARLHRHRFAVSGSYLPDVAADVTLYRRGRGRSGDAVDPDRYGGNMRTFRFPARALAPGSYEVRVKVTAHNGVGSTHSAPFTIPRR